MILPNKFKTTHLEFGTEIIIERLSDGSFSASWNDGRDVVTKRYNEESVRQFMSSGMYTKPMALDNGTGLKDTFSFKAKGASDQVYNATLYGDRVLVSWVDPDGMTHTTHYITDKAQQYVKVGLWTIVENHAPEANAEEPESKLTLELIREFTRETNASFAMMGDIYALADVDGTTFTANSEEEFLTLMESYKLLNGYKNQNE